MDAQKAEVAVCTISLGSASLSAAFPAVARTPTFALDFIADRAALMAQRNGTCERFEISAKLGIFSGKSVM